MNVLASGFICVFFTCLWIKIDGKYSFIHVKKFSSVKFLIINFLKPADCTTTHLGLRSDRIYKTGEKMTYNCKEYECEEKGGWTWTT